MQLTKEQLIDKALSHDGKERYATMLLATKAAYLLSEWRRGDYNPYECRFCMGYHVGHLHRAGRAKQMAAGTLELKKKRIG